MYKSIMVFLLAALVMTSEAQAAGNEWNDSFSKAKKTLERQVYYPTRRKTSPFRGRMSNPPSHT